MKVKLFQRLGRGEGIDDDVNAWLAEHEGVHVRSMEMSTHMLENERGLPDLTVICMLLYDEL